MRGQRHAPAALYPPGKTRYPLYRRLGGSQGRSGRVRKISPTPGFDPRTVQPVGSHYTDWATGPTKHVEDIVKIKTLVGRRCSLLFCFIRLCNDARRGTHNIQNVLFTDSPTEASGSNVNLSTAVLLWSFVVLHCACLERKERKKQTNKWPFEFHVLLTVRPGNVQLWLNDQLDAQLRYIKLLLL